VWANAPALLLVLGILAVLVAGADLCCLFVWRYRYGSKAICYIGRFRGSWRGRTIAIVIVFRRSWYGLMPSGPYRPLRRQALAGQVIGYDWVAVHFTEQGIASIGALALPVGAPSCT
jgi:heme/copper-type cytochrome/quinol oxidase subunit 2